MLRLGAGSLRKAMLGGAVNNGTDHCRGAIGIWPDWGPFMGASSQVDPVNLSLARFFGTTSARTALLSSSLKRYR